MMKPILIVMSEGCFGWEEARELVRELEQDIEVNRPVQIIDPLEAQKRVSEVSIRFSPAIVVDGKIVSLGLPSLSWLKNKLKTPRGGGVSRHVCK